MKSLYFTECLQAISAASQALITQLSSADLPLEIEAAQGSFPAFLIQSLFRAAPACGSYCIVVPTEADAEQMAQDLRSVFRTDAQNDIQPSIAILPWWGSMPYREAAPLSTVFGQRAKVLCDLAAGLPSIIIAAQRAFLTAVPPVQYLKSLLITLKTGGTIDTAKLTGTLMSYGYARVPKVQMHGEFALRGEVLDILMGGGDEMGGDEKAYRILFDFDRIESIKRFNTEDQSGQEKVGSVLIRPLKELIWTDDRIDVLSERLTSFEEFTENGRTVIEALMSHKTFAGEELFFPLAFDRAALLTDYLGGGRVFFTDWERLCNAQESLEREYTNLYRQLNRDNTRAGNQQSTLHNAPAAALTREVPAPQRVLLRFKDIAQSINKRVMFLALKGERDEAIPRMSARCEPGRSFFGNITYLREEFAALLAQGWNIVIAAETDVQAARIEELFKDISITGKDALIEESAKAALIKPRKHAAKRTVPRLRVVPLPLSSGFSLPDIQLMFVSENEIFGRKKRAPQSLKTAQSAVIDTFVDLNPGDFVVHVNYGIGLFKGIERITALRHERDYIKLEYLDEEFVFVPIEQVNLVQRYIGNQGLAPRLDKLGSKSWENRKLRVKKSVADIAEKLIALYSKRKKAVGFPFPKDGEWQLMFEAAFPFEETEDQLACVDDIKRDMESPHPMDRLVCGDVGYGKTEVAMRSCFKAIMGGKQAAFLAPTTILADQHYNNFLERFSQFPVRIALLSRFVERKKIKEILTELKAGNIDLLVGTHRIIQKDVAFQNLGLMVIDEEQRFGVKDKERLKELKHNVDCLTLSATPIPRTLHMSLLKIRDMSLLTTPPQNRHPIETILEEMNEDKLAAAIRQEVERGGQVFFLHNRIADLDETRLHIERLVPEMLVETAHGKMGAQELEDIMHRFIHGGFHVLVSTTIIENGIDIPNVNTIIIDKADMYGLSQLYQLRGRVGRSDRVAFAYLFYQDGSALSEVAMKRLEAISDFTDLGSGFKIAMKDMEIRGAGNLLGQEQSGDIVSVGFDLYMRLLDEAVHKLEDQDYQGENETLLDLEYTGFIPDSYIDSTQEKMEVYKKIASVHTIGQLEQVYAQCLDRFGPLPDEAASLLSLAEIRIICRNLVVSSLREKAGIVRVEFAKVSKIKIEQLLRLIKESAGKVRLDPKAPNVLLLSVGNIGLKEKSEFIREKLAAL